MSEKKYKHFRKVNSNSQKVKLNEIVNPMFSTTTD